MGTRSQVRGARSGSRVRVVLDPSRPGPVAPLALDPEQRSVVEHRAGHLLVLAGPGTGKTATLAELVVARVRDAADPVPPESVLALTFGRRAAQELADRIGQRLGGGPLPVVSTFHGYAYGLLRQHADPEAFLTPPRLLSAAEQDARLRELLAGAIGDGRLGWPEALAGAVGTRGIAEQVRALLARARSIGLDGRTMAAVGRRAGVPAWEAVGEFFEEYLDTLGFEGSLDYAELIHRAAVLVHDPVRGRPVRDGLRLVVVDEYQDTDPAQVALLRGLASGGAQVVAVGDPDQAIYAFRGADVRGILRFPDAFADPQGDPARVVVLRRTRRFAEPLARAARGVLGPVSLAPLPARVQRLHRTPVAVPGPSVVRVLTYPDPAAEAHGVVDILLRAHAGPGPGTGPVPWGRMGVIVRNPAVDGPRLARALRAAGVPVVVPAAETPLALEPAIQVLLGVVELALRPDEVPPDTGWQLLSGALGRLDPVELRRLGRALLPPADPSAPPADPSAPPAAERSSDALLTRLAAGREPIPAGVSSRTAAAVSRVVAAVGAARAAIDADLMVAEVLWAAWRATDWPERLRATALSQGPGAEGANRDLDALVVLTDLANRLPVHRCGAVGVLAFLADVRALRLPVEDRGHDPARADAVRLLSAHRAKGLEWDVVVVASVQEGSWPDLRLRSDLLRVAELGSHGPIDPVTHADLMAEERRLMYVACTRARVQLVVTAVAEPVDGGLQPSRFLPELGVPIEHVPVGARSTMSAEGLLLELRAAASAPVRWGADGRPDPQVEALRRAAVDRLAVLAAVARGQDGRAAAAGADPSRWWWAREVTGEASDDDPDLVLSASAVTAILRCPLQWFLDRRVGAGTAAGGAAVIGTIVHAVAEALVRGEVPAEPGAVAEHIDRIWDAMPFAARYQRARERQRVGQMVTALLAWHLADTRRVVGAEVEFAVTVPAPTPSGQVRLRGSIDRVVRDEADLVHLVDFKTGRTAVSAAAAQEHPQLGVYQLAAEHGGLGPGVRVGGAELVHVADPYVSGMPKVRLQAPLAGERTWAHDMVAEAARLAGGPGYPARPGPRCATCAYRVLCPSGPAGAAPPDPAGPGVATPVRPASEGGS